MLPVREQDLKNDFTVKELPTNTYALNDEANDYVGHHDGIEAMKQAIYFVLNIERYEWVIYSWNYGVELASLFGMPITYVIPELKRRIIEALTQDTRITAVDSFEFSHKRNKVYCKFTAHTLFGDITAEKEVSI